MVKLSNGRTARAPLVLSILVAIVTTIVTTSASPAEAQLDLGWLFGRRGPSYALDEIARRGQDTSICQPEIMVPYRGTALRYSGTVRVHPAFLERLPELERVAIEVATELSLIHI